jgi:PilZ domain
VARLTPTEAIALALAGLDTRVETATGDEIQIHPTATKGTRVWATAPRLQVAGGMELRARVVSPHDGRPWMLAFVIEDAQIHSADLAKIRLRATSVALDDTRRKNVRVPAGGVAWLTAVNCLDVVDGDRVDGTIVDLSRDGLAFATGRVLREGDRLILHARFFAQEVDAEVRVTSTRAALGGRILAGCRFIDIDRTNQARVDAIIAAADTVPERRGTDLDLGALRAAVNGPARDEPGGWRGIFRRS